MTKLSKHITVEEMQCRCDCHICRVSPDIIKAAEFARTCMNVWYPAHYYGFDEFEWNGGEIKLHVSSGCRCVKHNHKEGGVDDSRHITTYSPLTGGGKESKALDGWFYYGDSPYHNRFDASDVLRRMWEDELISGVVLYPSVECGICEDGYQKVEGMKEYSGLRIRCPRCKGDGILTEHRFHIEVASDRFWEDRR